MTDERWSSRMGFFLATVGAAVGLGNIWRFPAVLGQNGGGAYLVPYLLAAGVCAIPMLILELAIGRDRRTDVVSAVRSVAPGLVPLGWVVAGGVLVILSYYLVLTGWVLGFLWGWLTGPGIDFDAFTLGWSPIATFLIVAVITGSIVSFGVRDGIERIAKVVIPGVFVLLVGLAVYMVTLDGWRPAVEYLFTPEPSVLTDPGIWSAAFGQVFFSMSVGQGIMLTYGSYLDAETDIARSAVAVTVADIAAALLAGLVIFPVVFAAGISPAMGTELAFTTLPAAFGQLPAGQPIAVAFFALLFLAALTSAVALLEVAVASIGAATGRERRPITVALTAGVIALGLPSALSYSPVDLAIAGRPVLDLVDESVGTYMLPVSALIIVGVFVWRAELPGVDRELGRLEPAVRYLIPAVLVIVTLSRLAGVARPAWSLLLQTRREAVLDAAIILGVVLVLLAVGWLVRTRTRRRR